MTLEARHAILDALQAIVGEEYALAVMEHRKVKKCPLTPLAARILAKQFALCPDPKAAVEEMLNRGWTGFKAEWMRKAAKTSGRRTVFDVAMERFHGSESVSGGRGDVEFLPASQQQPGSDDGHLRTGIAGPFPAIRH